MSSPTTRVTPPRRKPAAIVPTPIAAGPVLTTDTADKAAPVEPTTVIPSSVDVVGAINLSNPFPPAVVSTYSAELAESKPVSVDDDPVSVTPGEALIISILTRMAETLDRVVDGLSIVGEQQQYTTDTFVGLKTDFDRMMSGGNPLKMIGQMLGQKGRGSNG